MSANFDQFPDRRPTESVKWRYFDPDVLPMWVADMDFVSPPAVVAALQERVAHGIFGYALEMPELNTAIAAWLMERHGWEVSPADIVLMPGVVSGIHLAAHATGQPGDGILIQPPVYPPFLKVGRNTGRALGLAELKGDEDGGYEIDFGHFEQAIDERTRMFLLCNPHNPVGRVYKREELEEMAEICLRHDLVICSDEIHADLVYSGQKHIPIASLDEEIAARTVTLMAPSKTFNIAGLQGSFAVITNPALRRKVCQAHQGLTSHMSIFGQVAALAAYTHGLPWLEDLLVYLQGNRDFLVKFISSEMPEPAVKPPEGTYLAWIDCRKAELTNGPFDFFLKEARVGMVDGKEFGKGGDGFVRLNFGCPRTMLTEALERMRNALQTR